MTRSDQSFVIRLAALVVAAIVVGTVLVLLAGLFDQRVDNEKIFAIVAPNFSTAVGAFVGLLGGLLANHTNEATKKDPE